MFDLKYPSPPVCLWIGGHCAPGIQSLKDGGVWGSALPHRSKAWPAPSPTHLHSKMFWDLSFSSLSHMQVCFLGCALLQSVHFINEKHVRPLPLNRKSVDIWYISIQTNTCDPSSKTGECWKLLKNEMPYHSGPGERMVCECNLKLLFCFASFPPSVCGGTGGANFWCKIWGFCYTQEQITHGKSNLALKEEPVLN